jgi:hypothetical protein
MQNSTSIGIGELHSSGKNVNRSFLEQCKNMDNINTKSCINSCNCLSLDIILLEENAVQQLLVSRPNGIWRRGWKQTYTD